MIGAGGQGQAQPAGGGGIPANAGPGSGGAPAAPASGGAKQPNFMQNFMKQLLPSLFGGQQQTQPQPQPQPAGFGSIVMPQQPAPPTLPFPPTPMPGVPNLMRAFQRGNQQLAQQQATPFPPPPIRPTPVTGPPPGTTPPPTPAPNPIRPPTDNSYAARRSRGETSQR